MEPSQSPDESAAKSAPGLSKHGDLIEVASSTDRRKCPKCGNIEPYQIKELVDKTKILNNYPIIYGKKYKCGQCGVEWRYST